MLNLWTIIYAIQKEKDWNREKVLLPVFDGFTFFGMSWTRFDYFYKISVCLQKLMKENAWGYIFSCILT